MLDISKIITDLYESEISFKFGSIYDGGYDFSFHNSISPLSETPFDEIISTGEKNIQKVFHIVVDEAIKRFPDSEFTKKYI